MRGRRGRKGASQRGWIHDSVVLVTALLLISSECFSPGRDIVLGNQEQVTAYLPLCCSVLRGWNKKIMIVAGETKAESIKAMREKMSSIIQTEWQIHFHPPTIMHWDSYVFIRRVLLWHTSDSSCTNNYEDIMKGQRKWHRKAENPDGNWEKHNFKKLCIILRLILISMFYFNLHLYRIIKQALPERKSSFSFCLLVFSMGTYLSPGNLGCFSAFIPWQNGTSCIGWSQCQLKILCLQSQNGSYHLHTHIQAHGLKKVKRGLNI